MRGRSAGRRMPPPLARCTLWQGRLAAVPLGAPMGPLVVGAAGNQRRPTGRAPGVLAPSGDCRQ
eukprot:3085758-Pyramimonas_sp.AAC.1